jgi:hypothetical protein
MRINPAARRCAPLQEGSPRPISEGMAFDSKFSYLAEMETFRVGFKGVKNGLGLPNLVPIDTTPQATVLSPADHERIVCDEMERRIVARQSPRDGSRRRFNPQ